MRAGEIAHVDVVAHARAVRRRIVVAEDGDFVARAGGRLQQERDEMGLRIVPLAVHVRGAGRIEIPEARGAKTVGFGVSLQRALERELGLAIRVRGRRRGVFFDDRLLGGSIHRSARREDQHADVAHAHRFEHRESADDVGTEVFPRLRDRLADERGGREMHDGVDTFVGERCGEPCSVEDIALDEPGGRNDGVAVACREVVVHDHRVARRGELFTDHAADVAGAAGDENAHAYESYDGDGARGPNDWSRGLGRGILQQRRGRGASPVPAAQEATPCQPPRR